MPTSRKSSRLEPFVRLPVGPGAGIPEACLHSQQHHPHFSSPFCGPDTVLNTACLLILVSLIVQMWKLRPWLREVSNLLTHSKQEEPSGFKPTSSLSPSKPSLPLSGPPWVPWALVSPP